MIVKRPYIANYIEEYDLIEKNVLIYDNAAQISFINKEKGTKAFGSRPDSTTLTETVENADSDEMYVGPDTTMETATVENRDFDENWFGPDTTTLTFTVENTDPDEYYII